MEISLLYISSCQLLSVMGGHAELEYTGLITDAFFMLERKDYRPISVSVSNYTVHRRLDLLQPL